MRVLIVTGGHVNDTFAQQVIRNGSFEKMIAVDAGIHFCFQNGFLPHCVVGDFDSASGEELECFLENPSVEVCRLNAQKDDTDTEHAVRMAIAEGAMQITILGATGTRLDHVLSNIGLLGIGLEKQVQIELLDEYNRIYMINHPISIRREMQFGQFVSLIPVTPKVSGVTLTGFRYPLNAYSMGGFNSLGISNEIIDEVAEISFEDGILLVIESRDDVKY